MQNQEMKIISIHNRANESKDYRKIWYDYELNKSKILINLAVKIPRRETSVCPYWEHIFVHTMLVAGHAEHFACYTMIKRTRWLPLWSAHSCADFTFSLQANWHAHTWGETCIVYWKWQIYLLIYNLLRSLNYISDY